MITREQYEKAKAQIKESQKLIDDYRAQEEKARAEAQQKREETCDHEYRPTNYKWQSASQMECLWCGKTIN